MATETSVLRAIFEADESGFTRALDNVQGGIGKTLGSLAGLAAGIAGAFAVGNSITKALEFDATLANIRSTTKATAEDTAALGEMLKAAVADSTIKDGLSEIGGAYYEIVGGVQDATMQQEIFTNAVMLAEAGQASMASTTNALIGAMNNYGASGLTAANASDILQRAVDMGKTNMTELGTALGPIAGNAAVAGLSFEELAADTALLTTKNVSASVAATRVNATLSALKTPNEAMKKGLKELGYASGEAAIKQLGLQGTLSALNDTLTDTPGAFNAALGSTEAQGAAAALLGENYKEFFKTFTEGVDGATAKAREIQLDSVSAQFTKFQNALSVAGLSIGQAFLPALNILLSGFNAFTGDVQKMGLGPAIEKWWNMGMDWLNTNGPTILQGALKAALDIGQDIVAFVQTNGPNVVSGLIGLWEDVSAWFQDTAPGLFQEALKKGIQIGQDIGKFIIDNGPNIIWGVMDWIDGALVWVKNNLGPKLGDALKAGLELIGNLGALIKDNAPDIGLAVGNWLRGAFTGLATIFQDAIAGLFSGGLDTSGLQGGDIAADLIPQASVFEQLAQGAVDAMTGVFQTGLGLIGGLFEGIFGLKKGTIKETFDKFFGKDGVVSKAFEDGKKFISGFITKLDDIGKAMVAVFSGIFDVIIKPFKDALVWLGKQLLELADKLPVLQNELRGIGAGLVNFGGGSMTTDSGIGFHALGGRMQAGQAGVVGDGGMPELWIPDRSGTVIAGPQAAGMMGGSGGGNLTIHGLIINGVEDVEAFFDKLSEEANKRGLQLGY